MTEPARAFDAGVVTPDGKPDPRAPRWRRDFPVDLPEDHYVARRDFTRYMVLTSFAFVVGQIWIGVKNVYRHKRGAPPITRIAAVEEMPIGSTKVFAYPDPHNPCLLIRTGEYAFLAYEQKCTQLSCAVQPQVDDNRLRCPCHQGFFDLATGRPTAGPPRRALPRVRIEIRGGQIYATAIEENPA
jgi:Rieske Fe-S protein